jgi:hypothetical protein
VQFNAAMTNTQSIIASSNSETLEGFPNPPAMSSGRQSPPALDASRQPAKTGAGRTISLAVGRRIVNDDVIGRPHPDNPFRAGETIYAHTKLASFRDGFLEHVWKRDGVEVLREVMPIGEGRCWRTWSYHVLAAGAYTVEVFAPDGARLAWRAFNAL